MNERLIGLATGGTTALAYFAGGLVASLLFWVGLLFEYPLFPSKVAFLSTSLGLVVIGWTVHSKFAERPSMRHSPLAFIIGGTISAIVVWLLYIWIMLIVSIAFEGG